MPALDREQGRLVVSVVYDGPALAGKTTNLTQLCQFFTTRKRSELYVPEEREGRTLYFDWLELSGGLVGGYPLLCRLITVPGQAVLSRRRQWLLGLADAVVFVCDSSPGGVDEARSMFETLHQLAEAKRSTPLPVVVQANKQDGSDALDPDQVALRLGARPEHAVVPAQAARGVGVRETVVLAIRGAAGEAQDAVLRDGADALVATLMGAEDVYQRLREQDAEDARRTQRTPSDHREVLRREAVATVERATPAPPADGTPWVPPLPTPDVPSGHIWPASTGRDALRRIPASTAKLRSDLLGRHGAANGSGKHDVVIYEAGMWCLKTTERRRYDSVDLARDALVRLARQKMLLGDLMIPKTVLSLHPDGYGCHWLWTTTPWLETLQARLDHALKHEHEPLIAESLVTFARTIKRGLELAARSGTVLDLHPSNVAALGRRVFYLDDDIAEGNSLVSVGYSILHRFDEYANWPKALTAYLGELVEVLGQLPPDTLRQCQFIPALSETIVRTETAGDARRELLAALPHAL